MPSHGSSPATDPTRARRLLHVVRAVAAGRSGDAPLPDDEIIQAHPDLMPELGQRLADLRRVEQVRQRAVGGSSGLEPGRIAAQLRLGDALPGYELIGEIHRGGQGVVYEGVQRSTRRRVAIKVLREGPFAAVHERARFEREARILASLQHPHIVTIHDSGEVAGHFYLVMDFVEGRPLDEWSAECGVRSAERPTTRILPLFAAVCDAVHAAHVRGIIHRDLKPSNILIDPHGEPRVLDFGLAKFSLESDASAPEAIRNPQSTTRNLTLTGQFVGSLPWASPEQVEGDRKRTDIRTDIYSLGVLMYRALTGRHPYPVDGTMRSVLDHICSNEPDRPSRVSRALDDELDAILLKCLAKQPERRYQSAAELGRDIVRYLRGEAVEARRESPSAGWYIARKIIRRHRAAASIAAVFVFLIAAAAAALALQARSLAKERDDARTARTQAQQHAQQAEVERDHALRIQRMLANILTSVDPRTARGRDVTVLRDVLDRAAEQVGSELGDRPALEASVRETIGRTYLNLSQYDAAEQQLSTALEIRRAELGLDDPHPWRLTALLGRSHWERGSLPEAQALFEQAIENLGRILGEQNQETLAAMNNLALIYKARGDLDGAAKLLHTAAAGLREIHGDEHAETLATMTNLATAMLGRGKLAAAEATYADVLSQLRATSGDDDPGTMTLMNNLGDVRRRLGRLDDAEPLLCEALERRRRVLGDEHALTLQSMTNLAQLRLEQRSFDEAEGLLREALEGLRATVGVEHNDTQVTMNRLAAVLMNLGRFEEAEPLLVESVQTASRAFGPNHSHALAAMNRLAELRRRQGRLDEAEPLLIAVRDRLLDAAGPGHPNTLAVQVHLGTVWLEQGRIAEAHDLLQPTRDRLQTVRGPRHFDSVKATIQLAAALSKLREFDEAASRYAEVLPVAAELYGTQDPGVALLQKAHAECLIELSRLDEADAALQASLAILQTAREPSDPDLQAVQALIEQVRRSR